MDNSIESRSSFPIRFPLSKHLDPSSLVGVEEVEPGFLALPGVHPVVVVVGEDGLVGVDEVEPGFLALPGVDPALLHHDWIKNHYK